MTTNDPPTSFRTRLKQNPATMLHYLLMSSLIVLSTYFAFIFAAITGHIATWPLLSQLSFVNFTSNIGISAFALFLCALAWGTPYIVGYFMSAPFNPSPNHHNLPKIRIWGLWAIPLALATLALIWFSPLWAPFSSIGTHLSQQLPSGMGNNTVTYGLLVLPMATAYTLFTRDDLQKDNSTDHRHITTDSATDTSGSSTNSTSPTQSDNNSTINKSDLPGDVSESDSNSRSNKTMTKEHSTTSEDSQSNHQSPLNEYTYSWQQPPDLSFRDVGGMDTVKEELEQEILAPLQGDTEKYEKFGVSIPNLLFHGPPGTGKTFMAKALSGELGHPYVKLSASDITSKWINESGDKISTLFDEAAEIGDQYGYAVVFVDEIDALLSDRGMDQQHSENKKVVDEFLNHLSGTDEDNILFIGATNHFQSLDSAAIRSGRIDKKIHVGLPDLEARISVLAAQLEDRPGTVPAKSDLHVLAKQLDGVSCADIESVVDRAARRAVERDATEIALKDLVDSVEDELQS